MKRKDLKKLYNNGLISSKPFQYFDIKDKVAQYVAQGVSKTDAVALTSALRGVTPQTVWNALKSTKNIELD